MCRGSGLLIDSPAAVPGDGIHMITEHGTGTGSMQAGPEDHPAPTLSGARLVTDPGSGHEAVHKARPLAFRGAGLVCGALVISRGSPNMVQYLDHILRVCLEARTCR